MNHAVLPIADTLSLVQEYDGQTTALWNLYIGVVAAIVAIFTADKWKPNPRLLAAAFGVFAINNMYGLSRTFEARRTLIMHAQSLLTDESPALHRVLSSLTPSPVWAMIAGHLALDLFVVAIILVFGTQHRNPQVSNPE